MRVGAEIADTGMDVELAVRRDAQEAVEAVGAGRVIALADPDAGDLVAVALAGALLLLLPAEHHRGFVERLFHECAGHRALIRTDLAV